MTSRRLPKSKTLIIREGGGSHVFFIFFIADFQGLEDIFGRLSLSGEVLDEQVDGCGRSDYGGGG